MDCTIDRHLLPIKAHYFFFWGGLSGVMPFLTVIAQNLGITATAVGFISALYPFLALIAKPCVGSLADYSKKLKLIIISTLVLTILFSGAIIFIPPIDVAIVLMQGIVICSSQGVELGIPMNSPGLLTFNEIIMTNLNTTGECHLCEKPHLLSEDFSEISLKDLDCLESVVKLSLILSINDSKQSHNNKWFPATDLTTENASHVCDTAQFYSCNVQYETMSQDIYQKKDSSLVYHTFQFWLFLVFFICSRTCMSILISLSDTACFEMLQGRYELYGKQRMWGALGWGCFSLIGGYFLTLTPHTDFSPGIYMMAVLLIIDAISVSMAQVHTTQPTGRILKDLGKLLKKLNILAFLVAVFFMGVLTGVQWNYFFWFLYSMGSSKLILSLILVCQCFLGELPFFFIAGKIIGKVGFENTISISFCAFGIRFLAYSFVTDPWYALPIELCQGLTFGLFFSAMAMYAKSVALKGTEGVMQGLVGGTFEGLGVAVGGLTGGVMIDLVGGHHMFRYASFVAFGCCFLHILSHLYFRRNHMMKSHEVRRPKEEQAEELNFLESPKV